MLSELHIYRYLPLIKQLLFEGYFVTKHTLNLYRSKVLPDSYNFI